MNGGASATGLSGQDYGKHRINDLVLLSYACSQQTSHLCIALKTLNIHGENKSSETSTTPMDDPLQASDEPDQALGQPKPQPSTDGPSSAAIEYRRLCDLVMVTHPPQPRMLSLLMLAHIEYCRETGLEAVAAQQWLTMIDSAIRQQQSGDMFMRSAAAINELRRTERSRNARGS